MTKIKSLYQSRLHYYNRKYAKNYNKNQQFTMKRFPFLLIYNESQYTKSQYGDQNKTYLIERQSQGAYYASDNTFSLPQMEDIDS